MRFSAAGTSALWAVALAGGAARPHAAAARSAAAASRVCRPELVAPTNIRMRRRGPLVTKVRKVLNQRSEEHTSELQSRQYLVCRLLLEKKTNTEYAIAMT